MSKAPDETSRADGKATDGPIPGFHGITLYDKATGVGFFTYSFSDPSEKDDFDFENTVGANVSDGWLRLSGPNQRADHKAHFRTVHMKGEADCSLNQQPIMDLVEVPGVAGQLWPDRRSFGIYVAKGKGQDSIPIPGWNPKSVSFTFDVRENSSRSLSTARTCGDRDRRRETYTSYFALGKGSSPTGSSRSRESSIRRGSRRT